MNAEILCVGSEILLGDIVNTNVTYIARALSDLGINVYHQSVIGDNHSRLTAALHLAMSRSDCLIITGGLGPTNDDVTKEAVADYLGRALVVDQAALDHLMDYFNKLGKTPGANNLKQATIPEGTIALPNRVGLAPGIICEVGDQIIILMPGPPREMQAVFHDGVLPYLEKFAAGRIVSHTYHLFGIGESSVDTMLGDLAYSNNPSVAPYAKEGEVLLRVSAKAADHAAAEALLAPVDGQIEALFAPYIFGRNGETLADLLAEALIERGATIALAESCTGGLMSKVITDYAGSSSYYLGGVCSYSNSAKEHFLHVSSQILDDYGAVSPETALAMAQGAQRAFGSDYALSTTGLAGPDGGSDDKPVGLVYIGIIGPDFAFVHKFLANPIYISSRQSVRENATREAFVQLLKKLRENA